MVVRAKCYRRLNPVLVNDLRPRQSSTRWPPKPSRRAAASTSPASSRSAHVLLATPGLPERRDYCWRPIAAARSRHRLEASRAWGRAVATTARTGRVAGTSTPLSP